MSEHEAPARFYDWCAARHRKVETRRLWRSRCMMHAQRSPLTNVRVRFLRRRAIRITGIPKFAPEILHRVRVKDPMKSNIFAL
jgi:hypothetical protein